MNLADLVKNENPDNMVNQSKESIEQTEKNPVEEKKEISQTTNNFSAPIIDFSSWFLKYSKQLPNINHSQIDIRGIDPMETMVCSYLDPKGGEFKGNPKKLIKVITRANTTPVLSLPPVGMKIFNNGFFILYGINEKLFIKTYGTKTGLFYRLCGITEDGCVPFPIGNKIKRKDIGKASISIPIENIEAIQSQMNKPVNMEDIVLLYPQISKTNIEFKTLGEVVKWFNERLTNIFDVNHYIQIDEVLLNLFFNVEKS